MANNIRVDISPVGGDGAGPGRGPTGRTPNTCPSCGSHYREDEMVANLRVCVRCGHHFPVSARERVVQLVDEGSFAERDRALRATDPLEFVDSRPYEDRLRVAEAETGLADAVLAGSAAIGGLPVALVVMDFGFMGGSMGSVVGEKFLRAARLAATSGTPLVAVSSSGGARMQEGVLALMQMAKTVAAVDELRDAGVPYVSVLAHPTTGGVAASFAALGDVLLAEPGALLSFSGPRVVKQTTREALPADFGLAESNLRHGHIDRIVPRPELRDTVARLVALLSGGAPYRPGPFPELDPVGTLRRVFAGLRRRMKDGDRDGG